MLLVRFPYPTCIIDILFMPLRGGTAIDSIGISEDDALHGGPRKDERTKGIYLLFQYSGDAPLLGFGKIRLNAERSTVATHRTGVLALCEDHLVSVPCSGHIG